MIKKILYFSFFLGLITFLGLYSENFTVPSQKKVSLNQVKEEIVDHLAQILDQECKSIEIQARIQQELCKKIAQLAQGNNDSYFSKASKKELVDFLNKLSKIKEDNNHRLKEFQKNLSFLISNSSQKKV